MINNVKLKDEYGSKKITAIQVIAGILVLLVLLTILFLTIQGLDDTVVLNKNLMGAVF